MQTVKHRFHTKDLGRHSSLQSCIRTDDIDLVGDGTHLTSFEMLGNFSFGNNDYKESIYMWNQIIHDMDIPVDYITCHPTQSILGDIWVDLGYTVKDDLDCVWSDGEIGGYCCEVYSGDLEICNLVNPMGDCVDVGFGLERLIQIIEKQNRVDDTSLFDISKTPIVRDHIKTIDLLISNGIFPGGKGRNWICKKIVRNLIPYKDEVKNNIKILIEKEIYHISEKQTKLQKFKDEFCNENWDYWWNTHGLSKEEIEIFQAQNE